jgi:hypothetical protein
MPPPPKLFVSDGSALGTTGVVGVGEGCAGGLDAIGAVGTDTMGTGGTNDRSIGWEQRYPSTGCACPGGAQR